MEGRSKISRPTRLGRDVELRIDEALRGDGHAGERLIVTRLGGSVDGLALQVPGAATFARSPNTKSPWDMSISISSIVFNIASAV